MVFYVILVTNFFDRCKTNVLKKSNNNDDILERNHADLFDSDDVKGTCKDKLFDSNAQLLVFSLESTGTDGWLMTYAMIFFKDGSYWNCHNTEGHWLEVGYSYHILCKKIRG